MKVTLSLPVHVRLCEEADLPKLEWFGMFTAHRGIIRSAFDAQQQGRGAIILAIANDHPIGQVWVELARPGGDFAGFIWAVRVFPWLQGLGIGRILLSSAEELLVEHGFASAEATVDIENTGSQRFFQTCGYQEHGRRVEKWSYTTPEGQQIEQEKERLLFWKRLPQEKNPPQETAA